MRILLIEPDHILAKTYGKALQSAGYQVHTAATGQDAITTADANQPDLVILELQLVEHSGIEFLYEFRSYTDWQNIPAIIHSQVPPGEFTDSQQQLQELGVSSYLYKPRTSLKQLLNTINELSPEAAKPA